MKRSGVILKVGGAISEGVGAILKRGGAILKRSGVISGNDAVVVVRGIILRSIFLLDEVEFRQNSKNSSILHSTYDVRNGSRKVSTESLKLVCATCQSRSTDRSPRHLWSIPDKASQNIFTQNFLAQTDKRFSSYGFTKFGLE
jgi:hypothetical protein